MYWAQRTKPELMYILPSVYGQSDSLKDFVTYKSQLCRVQQT